MCAGHADKRFMGYKGYITDYTHLCTHERLDNDVAAVRRRVLCPFWGVCPYGERHLSLELGYVYAHIVVEEHHVQKLSGI